MTNAGGRGVLGSTVWTIGRGRSLVVACLACQYTSPFYADSDRLRHYRWLILRLTSWGMCVRLIVIVVVLSMTFSWL